MWRPAGLRQQVGGSNFGWKTGQGGVGGTLSEEHLVCHGSIQNGKGKKQKKKRLLLLRSTDTPGGQTRHALRGDEDPSVIQRRGGETEPTQPKKKKKKNQ